jgi:hypothetical protein
MPSGRSAGASCGSSSAGQGPIGSFSRFELVERLVPGTVDPELREQLVRAATPALQSVVGV